MISAHFHSKHKSPLINPDLSDLEIVERKFRGHPDSLADMVAQRFSQIYIQESWKQFPELANNFFPNFSADKVTLCGASTEWEIGRYKVSRPIHALLIGKITQLIGNVPLDVDSFFQKALSETFAKCLGHDDALASTVRHIYGATLAGSDHDPSFYNPKSIKSLLKILSKETKANDTVYVVAYAPLSATESLSIFLDNITASLEFKKLFPEIGSDIKTMIRRRMKNFDLTMCLPVFPERVDNEGRYRSVLKDSTAYLHAKALAYLKEQYGRGESVVLNLSTNTKDTKDKKYYAVWGTSLSKGDIGAVGRGNRQQGFISGIRPSTNEAFPGKNPNHFAGIVFQQVAEKIAQEIFQELGFRNVVYITANNGDELARPNSIDILLENGVGVNGQRIRKIISNALDSIVEQRMAYIQRNIYAAFMKPVGYGL